ATTHAMRGDQNSSQPFVAKVKPSTKQLRCSELETSPSFVKYTPPMILNRDEITVQCPLVLHHRLDVISVEKFGTERKRTTYCIARSLIAGTPSFHSFQKNRNFCEYLSGYG
ncbi:hypothetical protein CSKR_112246, partial [Clonorchis sinensis]